MKTNRIIRIMLPIVLISAAVAFIIFSLGVVEEVDIGDGWEVLIKKVATGMNYMPLPEEGLYRSHKLSHSCSDKLSHASTTYPA